MSHLEVLQGMGNKSEFVAVQKMRQRRRAVTLPVTAVITQRATELMEAMTLT